MTEPLIVCHVNILQPAAVTPLVERMRRHRALQGRDDVVILVDDGERLVGYPAMRVDARTYATRLRTVVAELAGRIAGAETRHGITHGSFAVPILGPVAPLRALIARRLGDAFDRDVREVEGEPPPAGLT